MLRRAFRPASTYPAMVAPPASASALPASDEPPRSPPATRADPIRVRPIPTHPLRRGDSPHRAHAARATNTGVVETSRTEAATVVRRNEVIQVAKWRARKTPESAGSPSFAPVEGSRRANGSSAAAPAAQRQNEIASGSAPGALRTRMAENDAATTPVASRAQEARPGAGAGEGADGRKGAGARSVAFTRSRAYDRRMQQEVRGESRASSTDE
jgi:hypothetical protein